MATTTTKSGNTITERTFRVEFETPRSGYSLRIHREQVITDADGAELAVKSLPFAFNETVSKAAQMQATETLAATFGKTPGEIITALAAWFDALVEERRAEVAQAQADEPAS